MMKKVLNFHKGSSYITVFFQGNTGYRITEESPTVWCWQEFKAMYFATWLISTRQPTMAKYFNFKELNLTLFGRD